jgi:hypothetical protein
MFSLLVSNDRDRSNSALNSRSMAAGLNRALHLVGPEPPLGMAAGTGWASETTSRMAMEHEIANMEPFRAWMGNAKKDAVAERADFIGFMMSNKIIRP